MKRKGILLALIALIVVCASLFVGCKTCKHEYSEWETVTEATCEAEGLQQRVCRKCGIKEEQPLAANGHDYGSLIQGEPATCTVSGMKAYYDCSACHKMFDEDKKEITSFVIAPLGHDEVNHEKKDPTCTEKGYKEYVTCARCEYTTFEELPALGHKEVSHKKKEATCTESGWNEYVTCERCDYTTFEELPARGHDYAETFTIDKEETCTEKGVKSYHCKRCEERREVTEIAALGHDEVEHVAVDPTCTENGNKAYVTCSRCTYTTFEEIPALGHKEVSHEKKDPTCTEKGNKAYVTCERCEYTTFEEIDALGHDYDSPIQGEPATCTASGTKAHYNCSACHKMFDEDKKEITSSVIAPLGHKEVSHEKKDPTCTEKGNKAYVTCARCDYTTFEEIKALGHEEVTDEAVEATCTKKGLTEGKHCSRCNAVIVAQEELDALGHDYAETFTIDKKETCTENGSKSKHCTRCGDKSEVTVIEAPGHGIVNHEKKDPTCTESGWKAYDTCSHCDYTTFEEIPALGHDTCLIEKAHTCTEDGIISHEYCFTCGKRFIGETEVTAEEVVDKARHDAVEFAEDKETCTRNGMIAHQYCPVCRKYFVDGEEKSFDELLIAAHHEFIDVAATESTCTEQGYRAHKECTVCGKYFQDNGGDPMEASKEYFLEEFAAHEYGDLIVEEGKRKHYRCSVCDKTFNENFIEITDIDLPAEHNFSDWISGDGGNCGEQKDGTIGHYTCTDPECEGKYFDVNFNEIDSITAPYEHAYVYATVNENVHTVKCGVCGTDFGEAEHVYEYTGYANGETWWGLKTCVGCKILETNPITAFSDVQVIDTLVFKENSLFGNVRYELSTGTVENPLEYAIGKPGAYLELLEELAALDESAFPLVKTVTVGVPGVFTKDVDFTFDIERWTAIPYQKVHQKGYLNSLSDISYYKLSNLGYEGNNYSLRDATIIDNGGFDPDCDFTDGEVKEYTIRFKDGDSDQTMSISFYYVNEPVVYGFLLDFGRRIITVGQELEFIYNYTDGTIEYGGAERLTLLGGSFDTNTVGEYTVTFIDKDGYAIETITIKVVEEYAINSVGRPSAELGGEFVSVEVYYLNGSYETVEIPLKHILDYDADGDGVPFDVTKEGIYDVVVAIHGRAVRLNDVRVFDPLDPFVTSLAFDGDYIKVVLETDENGDPIIDLSKYRLICQFADENGRYVNITDEMVRYTEDGNIEITYKNKSVVLINGNDFVIATRENPTEISLKYVGEAAYPYNVIVLMQGGTLEGYCLAVRVDQGYYRVSLETSMIFDTDGNPFDFNGATGTYTVVVKYGELTLECSLLYYSEDELEEELSFGGSIDDIVCGTQESVLQQLEKLTFRYLREKYYVVNSYGVRVSLDEEYLTLSQLNIITDLTQIDFSVCGSVVIKVSYRGAEYSLYFNLIPDFSGVESKNYLFAEAGTTIAIYENGYLMFNGSVREYTVIYDFPKIISMGYGMYVVDEEKNEIRYFTAEKEIGGEGITFTYVDFEGDETTYKLFTDGTVAFVDAYDPYGDVSTYYADYRPEENVIVIEYYGRFNIGENNVLTRILEGNELYRKETLEDETAKAIYSFRDNGTMYYMASFLNVETGEWSEPIVVSAYEWIQEDESNIKVIISRINGEFQMVKINADGTLDFGE